MRQHPPGPERQPPGDKDHQGGKERGRESEDGAAPTAELKGVPARPSVVVAAGMSLMVSECCRTREPGVSLSSSVPSQPVLNDQVVHAL